MVILIKKEIQSCGIFSHIIENVCSQFDVAVSTSGVYKLLHSNAPDFTTRDLFILPKPTLQVLHVPITFCTSQSASNLRHLFMQLIFNAPQESFRTQRHFINLIVWLGVSPVSIFISAAGFQREPRTADELEIAAIAPSKF